MLSSKYFSNINVLNSYIKLLVAGLGASLLINLILAVAVLFHDPIITLRPPVQTQDITMRSNSADGEFKKSWGLYISNILGNVRPGSTDIILEAIELLATPRTYKEMREIVAAQIDAIEREQVTLEFSPRSVAFEPKSGLVFVTGTQLRRGTSGDPERQIRTYEMNLSVKDYRPKLKSVEVYEGNPLTLKAKRLKKEQEEARRQENK